MVSWSSVKRVGTECMMFGFRLTPKPVNLIYKGSYDNPIIALLFHNHNEREVSEK